MRPGRTRPLTSAERRLWAEVARSVAPLPGRALPEGDEIAQGADGNASSASPGPSAPAARGIPAKPALPPLTGLDRKLTRALSRGRRTPEATLDLHGLTQADAHAALLRFLASSQQAGRQLVRIVTGKGRPADGLHPGERGVLRRVVPHWLALPELRPVVLGWDEASPHQGGTGALHVRLRRRRAP